MISQILNHPLYAIQKMKQRHKEEMTKLVQELELEKEKKIEGDIKFLTMGERNASPSMIDYYTRETEQLYDNAFKFIDEP
jgi:hypothetical protein